MYLSSSKVGYLRKILDYLGNHGPGPWPST